MRQRLLLVAAVTAAALVFAACSDDSSTTSDSHMNGGMGSMSSTTMGSMGHGGMGGHGDNSPVADGARRIDVAAHSFAFEPDEIHVQSGEDVAIVLTSDDVLHDFTIDDLDTHVSADAGDTAEGGLRADEPGRYTYYCTVEGHREDGMEGTLVVE